MVKRNARAGECHQLVGHQIRHRAVQALEGEPGKVARASADATEGHLGHALGGKAGNEAIWSRSLYTIHIASQHVPNMPCIAHILYFEARAEYIAHIVHIARTRGRVDVQRLGV